MTQDTQISEINTSPGDQEICFPSDSDLSDLDLEPFYDKWPLDQSFEDMCTSAQPESEGPSGQGCQPIKEPTVDASVENTNDSAEIPSSETIQECKETPIEVAVGYSPKGEKPNFKERCTYLRSKLQNTLLSDQQPNESMEKMCSCLKMLEEFEDSAIDVVREFKLDKVLRKIRKLDFIPRDEEFQFRPRVIDLLERWEKLPFTKQLHPTSLERQPLLETKPKTKVIDLTEDDDAEPSVPGINTLSSSIIENDEPASGTTENGLSPGLSSKSKRKRNPADISSNSCDDTPKPASSKKKRGVNDSPGRRPQSKQAKFQTHLKAEIGWLAESMDWINERIKESTQELALVEEKRSDFLEEKTQELASVEEKRRVFLEENVKERALVEKKRSDLLEENAQEQALVERKRSKFLDFKRNIGDWGAQDNKVTRELEKSK